MKALRRISLLIVLALIVSIIPASVANAASRPARPAEVRVAATGLGIKVNWDKISTAEKYEIQRREMIESEWGAWETLLTLKENEYTDPNVENQKKYQYRVRAFNSAGWGERKTSSSVKAVEITQKPAASTKITVNVADSGIVIKWNKVEGAIKYGLYRSEYDGTEWGSWKSVKTLTKTEYTDNTVTAGKTYKYRVRAYNNAGWGPYKNSSSVEVPLPLPAAPSKVEAVAGSSTIKVTWSAVATAEKYRVYRKEYDGSAWGSWVKLKDTTAKSYTDENATPGVKYKYTVKAYNKTGWGDKKDSNTAEIITKPAAPASVKVTKENGAIKVKWSTVNSADKYGLYRREFVKGAWKSWKKIGEFTTASYKDKKVSSNTLYQYRVRAYNAVGWGEYKKSKNITALSFDSDTNKTITVKSAYYADSKEKALKIILKYAISGEEEDPLYVYYPAISDVLAPEDIKKEIPISDVNLLSDSSKIFKNCVKVRYTVVPFPNAEITYAIRFKDYSVLDDEQMSRVKDVKACLDSKPEFFASAKDEFEKVCAIQELITFMDNNVYDEDCYYRTIMNMKDGYASEIYQAFCLYNGVDCVTAEGRRSTQTGYQWNQVKVNGKWYNVDEYFFINQYEHAYGIHGPEMYLSILKSDVFFQNECMEYEAVYFYKECTSTEYDLYGFEDCLVTSKNGAIKCLKKQAESDKKVYVIVYKTDSGLDINGKELAKEVLGNENSACFTYKFDNGYTFIFYYVPFIPKS